MTLAIVKMDKKSIRAQKYPLFLMKVKKIKLLTRSSVSWRFDEKFPIREMMGRVEVSFKLM